VSKKHYLIYGEHNNIDCSMTENLCKFWGLEYSYVKMDTLTQNEQDQAFAFNGNSKCLPIVFLHEMGEDDTVTFIGNYIKFKKYIDESYVKHI
tara:strand:- start:18787 stop:19065 length:279 start_codon:yes stop_codon:yes gene_type:complete